MALVRNFEVVDNLDILEGQVLEQVPVHLVFFHHNMADSMIHGWFVHPTLVVVHLVVDGPVHEHEGGAVGAVVDFDAVDAAEAAVDFDAVGCSLVARWRDEVPVNHQNHPS